MLRGLKISVALLVQAVVQGKGDGTGLGGVVSLSSFYIILEREN